MTWCNIFKIYFGNTKKETADLRRTVLREQIPDWSKGKVGNSKIITYLFHLFIFVRLSCIFKYMLFFSF